MEDIDRWSECLKILGGKSKYDQERVIGSIRCSCHTWAVSCNARGMYTQERYVTEITYSLGIVHQKKKLLTTLRCTLGTSVIWIEWICIFWIFFLWFWTLLVLIFENFWKGFVHMETANFKTLNTEKQQQKNLRFWRP